MIIHINSVIIESVDVCTIMQGVMEIVEMSRSHKSYLLLHTLILYSSQAINIIFGQIFRVPEIVNVSAACALLMHAKSPLGTAHSWSSIYLW